MNYPDDQNILTLILSAKTRNEGYRYLLGKYKEKLYWHIRRLVDNHDDADDILQNTFVKVVRNIDNFKQKASIYTWLYRIATNESINFINDRKKQNIDQFESIDRNQSISVDTFDEHNVLHQLQVAIKALPEKQRIVFNLRYYDEMPYQHIADITDTSVGALKASYHHAVKKIEEHLKTLV